MRVVLDVNVWVSGLLWGGVPGRIFDLAQAKQIDIFISEPILVDVEEILRRKKFQTKITALDTSVEELFSTVKLLSQLCLITAVDVCFSGKC
ncbi:MAG: putative toxin-antitoxin system toxin component, PIN family [Goleter apudmare HA4340-LM2]|jgi:hypothetical protein|nr:putative toxin-antitoxin system toxin component, PIN family [Goleter apudmare HA4340-LM2]